MPPKKRTVSNADRAAPARKNQKRADDDQAEQGSSEDATEQPASPATEDETAADEGDKVAEDLKKKDPEEWICMDRPFWDFKAAAGDEDEEDEDEDDDDEGAESLRGRYKKEVLDKAVWPKPAAELPEHKWKIIWTAWEQLCELKHQESYRCPDNFDMHIYTDFMSYALNALVEERVSGGVVRF